MSNQHNPWIQKCAKRNNLDWLLIKAVIKAESDYTPKTEDDSFPRAVSRVGARGLMQIMPKTWVWVVQDLLKKDYKWDDAFDPEKNIEVGCRYIAWLYSYMKRYMAPIHPLLHKRMLCAYNWGIGNLQKNKWSLEGIPKETQDYIARVMKYWKRYQNGQQDNIKIPRKRVEIVKTLANGISKEMNSYLKKKGAK